MKKVILIIAFLPLLISSCVKELTDKIDLIDGNVWNPELAAPLIYGDFTISDFGDELSKENLEITYADDGTTIFLYRQPSIFSQTASEVFTIPNQSFSTFLEATGALPATGISATLNSTDELIFDLSSPDGDKIYEILLKDGTMNLNLNGNVPVTGEMNVTFNSLVINGNPLEINYSWSSTGTQVYGETVNLKDAIINLRSSDPAEINKFKITIETTINYDGSAMASTDGFQLDIELVDLDFSKLTASFAQRDISPQAEYFKLNFTDEIRKGKYELVDPKLHFVIRNSIGAPMDINFDQITSFADGRLPLSLSGTILDAPITIDHPTSVGQLKTTRIDIDKSNSNLPSLINYQPDSILYSITGKVNPANLTEEHFVLDTSTLVANVLLEVPLYGAIKNIVIREPYDFNGEDFNEVDNALLKISASNGLPLDAFVQGYFLDENQIVLDSLIRDNKHIVPAATVDSEGNADINGESSVEITLNKEQIERITATEKLVLFIVLNTPEALTKQVRFREEDKLKINIFGQTIFNSDL